MTEHQCDHQGSARQYELHRLSESRNGNRHGPDDDFKHDSDEQRDEARIGALLAADGLRVAVSSADDRRRCLQRRCCMRVGDGRIGLFRRMAITKILQPQRRCHDACDRGQIAAPGAPMPLDGLNSAGLGRAVSR